MAARRGSRSELGPELRTGAPTPRPGARPSGAACKRGLSIRATTYGSIVSILKNGLDRAFHEEVVAEVEPVRHANIRGQTYYH
jgi:hypothetical protein